MSWIIACFCGNLIDTPVCPHCGSRLPDWSTGGHAPPADRLPASSHALVRAVARLPGLGADKEAA